MSKKQQKIMDDFIASCDESNGGDASFDELPTVVLDRDTVHEMTVNSVIEGTNQYGDYIGFATDNNVVWFGGYEAEDVKRVVGEVEAPFSIQVLRTQVESKKNEGRTFNKVHAKLV